MKPTLIPAGLLLLICFPASAAMRFVDLNNPAPVAPYTSWATAATTIQDAVDAAVPGDEIMVTNGVYATGGRAVHGTMTNRVAVDKPVSVRSVNGPLVTLIEGRLAPSTVFGGSAIRCVYLTNGASLSGFTLTNGATHSSGNAILELSGGGVWCNSTSAVVSQCVIVGNHARVQGGGAYGGTLNNCLFTGNSATNAGATFSNVLNNCTIVGNSSLLGVAGAHSSTLNNCIVYFNVGQPSPSYTQSTLNYCCTTPQPAAGSGNITNDPLFVDRPGGNLRLHGDSPCVNAGNNADAPLGFDLDGNARIFNGIVDIGAFESQGIPTEVAPYIITQPTNKTVTVGSNVLFAVVAGGSSPLRFQWLSNAVPISNATNVAFTVTNAQLSHSGTLYAVIVTNVAGSLTSSNALLTVYSPPVPGTRYVKANNVSTSPPYTNWATAAQSIQAAVDIALPGDDIVVTNGVYSSGVQALFGNNRLAVTKPVTVRSVNGPEVTIIEGYQLPGTRNGNGAIRCVYLTNGAALIGFTMTNGGTLAFNGSYNETLNGGGVFSHGTNTVISNCVMIANSAASSGGGAYLGKLFDCLLTSNSALTGGGAGATELYNCKLTGNSAAQLGGGAELCRLFNCLLTGNSATFGGGAYVSMLSNCTVSSNSASGSAGGTGSCNAYNCIIYYNSAPADSNYLKGDYVLNFCCTSPMPPTGTGNLTNPPLFVDLALGNLRLQSGSLCINSGNNSYAPTFFDLDGHPRLADGTVDIGAYEYQGPFVPRITVQPTNKVVSAGSDVTFVVAATGTQPLRYQWNLNGSTPAWATNASVTLTNVQLAQSGTYFVTITNVVGSAVSSNAVLTALVSATRYVDAGNANSSPPYTSWATAARTIQDAIDAAVTGDEIIVTNGIYASGGRPVGSTTNRIVADKPVTLRSVNGPLFTTIQGYQMPGNIRSSNSLRCAYLVGGASIIGFTLTNGATFQDGGGVWCESASAVISNCVITGNAAANSGGGVYSGQLLNCSLSNNYAFFGGGAYQSKIYSSVISSNTAYLGGGTMECQLENCVVVDNRATSWGGGAYSGTLNNCTVVANFAQTNGGGSASAVLKNCVVYFNTAWFSWTPSQNDSFSAMTNCCTFPLPSGSGNITNNPLFVDLETRNLHLQPLSPCIDAGANSFVTETVDLNGNPRIRGSAVDMGAYEFQACSLC